MKNRIHLLITLLSVVALLLFVGYVEPKIDDPLVLAGFFALLLNSLFWVFYSILRTLKRGRVLYIIAFTLALATVYLLALSTLNSLGILDVLVAVVATALLIMFIIGPLRRQRGN